MHSTRFKFMQHYAFRIRASAGICRALTRCLAVGGLIAPVLLFIAGCGPDDPVLARVGDSEITETELEEFVDRLPEHLRGENQGVDADREHLNSVIDRELLLIEALARRLDTTAVLTRQIAEAEGQRLYERYQREVIAPRIEVSPEDMERGFRDMGFDRERLLSRILVKGSERDARAVLAQLGEGTAFSDLARQYSENDPGADETGKIGWIGLTGLRPFMIQQPEFTSLAVGETRLYRLSPAVWQIIRFEEDRQAQLQTYEDDVRKLLIMEQRWRRTEEEAELVRQKYETRYHPEAVQTLIRRVEERRDELSQVEAKQPLYTFTGGDTITAGDFVTRIRELKGSAAVTDSARIVDVLAEKELLHPYLFAREARERGWHEEEDFVAWRDHTYAGLLLEELMRAEVEDRLSLTEDQLRAYYDDHREKFHVGATVSLEEVHVKDEATARQLRDDIMGGASFAEILLRTGVASYGKHRLGGTMSLQSHLAERFPELVEASLAAEVGELVGPVYLEDAERYAILRVTERQDSRIRPFDEARKSVGHMSRVEQSDELVSALFQSVRDKYQNRIVIFDDRLEQRHTDR